MWNRQPTREVITKESVRQELMKSARGGVPIAAMMVVTAIVADAILIAAGCAAFPSKAQFEGEMFPFMELALAIMSFLIAALAAVFSMYMLISVVADSKYIREGRFTIVEDELVNMVREEPYRSFYSRRTQYQDVFYFWKTGRYVVTGIDGSSFEYSSVGDTFYVVVMEPHHRSKKQNRPRRAYNSKIYEYKQ